MTPSLTININDDPLEVARWYVTFRREYERLLAEHEDANDGGTEQTGINADDTAQVDEMIQRWINHNPVNQEYLRAAVKGLRGLGYVLALPQQRTSGDNRTYLRVLRPVDRQNAGTMNSESFNFIKTRALVEGVPGLQGGRYPSIKWAQPGSVETVIDVANRYLR